MKALKSLFNILSKFRRTDYEGLSCTAIRSDRNFRKLVKANLTGMKLKACKLYSDFTWADFSNSDLSYAEFSDNDLRWANFSNTNLNFTDFCRSDVNSAVFKDADLRGANLSEVKNLTKQQLSEAVTDQTTKLPENITLNEVRKAQKDDVNKTQPDNVIIGHF